MNSNSEPKKNIYKNTLKKIYMANSSQEALTIIQEFQQTSEYKDLSEIQKDGNLKLPDEVLLFALCANDIAKIDPEQLKKAIKKKKESINSDDALEKLSESKNDENDRLHICLDNLTITAQAAGKKKIVLSNLLDSLCHRSNSAYLNLSAVQLRGQKLRVKKEKGTLFGANLSGANLSGANLSKTNLKNANLECANLARANLSEALLDRANLKDACFTYRIQRPDEKHKPPSNRPFWYIESDEELAIDEYIAGANLAKASLIGADLRGFDLEKAHLQGAHLETANLEGANLKGANFKGAHLAGTKFEGADLEEHKSQSWYIHPQYRSIVTKKSIHQAVKFQDADLALADLPQNIERPENRRQKIKFKKSMESRLQGKKMETDEDRLAELSDLCSQYQSHLLKQKHSSPLGDKKQKALSALENILKSEDLGAEQKLRKFKTTLHRHYQTLSTSRSSTLKNIAKVILEVATLGAGFGYFHHRLWKVEGKEKAKDMQQIVYANKWKK
jgi:uncharacterized protein YjbI with pentapeptide repeats